MEEQTAPPRRWSLGGTRDLLHWSIGFRLEIPRATKHNYLRWVFKVRVLCFGVELRRLNDQRVPKTKPEPEVQ